MKKLIFGFFILFLAVWLNSCASKEVASNVDSHASCHKGMSQFSRGTQAEQSAKGACKSTGKLAEPGKK